MANSQSQGQKGASPNQQASEDWSHIEDQHERRRVQNRIAQRTYRARKKNEAEEAARVAENQQVAGAAYRAPNAEDMARNDNPSGLPSV
ncbi:MAG: hypothetical protein MMC23_002270 [Stictis urceolatum]|nr:hypothetical protein [Stictis urceolata]